MLKILKASAGVLCAFALVVFAQQAHATLTVGATSVASDGVLTLQGAGASVWQTSSGSLTLDAAAALNLGTATATSVSISYAGKTTTVNGALAVTQGTVLSSTLSVGGAVTLSNGATVDNATANQINLANASTTYTQVTRVGLLRAGFNGYGSEIGGSGINPFTVAGTGNRAGAELYYGYSGTTGNMLGVRTFLDNQSTTGSAGVLTGGEFEVRGNSLTGSGSTIATAQGLWAAVATKKDTVTNAIGVLSDLDIDNEGGHVTTWKAFDVTHSDQQGAVTNGYGLYLEPSQTNVTNWTDVHLASGPDILSGAGVPSSSSGTPGCNLGSGKTIHSIGSLYINTAGGASTTLYVCTGVDTWTAVYH